MRCVALRGCWLRGGGSEFTLAVRSAGSYSALNCVAHDKLGQVLTRVLDKMAINEQDVFTASEKHQLQAMLGLADLQIDAVVYAAKEIFQDAASFGQIDRNLLTFRGVDDDVLHIVEKTWRKKGRPVSGQIAAFHVETPPLVLQKTDWRLHLEMGSSKRSGQSQSTAIFQLKVVDKNSAANETETLDVKLSRAELHSLFLQLNAVQAELDVLPTPSAA